MEQPYKGRAIIHDNFTAVEVIIPAKRNWFIIVFLSFWLCGWFLGETFALAEVTGIARGNPFDFFIFFWLLGWTAGGFFVFKTLLWNLVGKEIITFESDQLTIDRKGSLFFRAKTYDTKEIKDMRAQEDINSNGGFFGRRNNTNPFDTGGTLRFDYGFKTIKFGSGLDEAEAKYILQKLKERHFIKDKINSQ